MTDQIACPDPNCDAPARIIDRWSFGSTSGPVEHVNCGFYLTECWADGGMAWKIAHCREEPETEELLERVSRITAGLVRPGA